VLTLSTYRYIKEGSIEGLTEDSVAISTEIAIYSIVRGELIVITYNYIKEEIE